MPIREKKTESGPMLEVEIFPITYQERKQPRATKNKVSAPKQKNLNDKNAKKYLVRLVNTNFTMKDIVVHLTYREGELPKSEKEARRDVTNYLRRVKRHREKNNLPKLKYIAVIEFREQEEGKTIRFHHHVIMSGMDRDQAEALWGKGWANAKRLQPDKYGFEAIARYISKDPRGTKRWSPSQNLKKPKQSVNDWKYSRREVMEMSKNPEDKAYFEKMYKGYAFLECKGVWNDIVGAVYVYIKMRKLKI